MSETFRQLVGNFYVIQVIKIIGSPNLVFWQDCAAWHECCAQTQVKEGLR